MNVVQHLSLDFGIEGFFAPLDAVAYSVLDSTQNIFRQAQYFGGRSLSSMKVIVVPAISPVLSIVSNSLRLSNSHHPAIVQSGRISSEVGLAIGTLLTLPNGLIELHQSSQIYDGEGARRAGQ